MPFPLAIPWDDTFSIISLTGMAICAVALLWLLILAFRTRWTWGLSCLVFFPLLLVFVPRHRARTWKAALLLSLGVVLFVFPIAYTRYIPPDLGPRDRIVDGERHLTLTGWDRMDYSVLRSKGDTVVLQMANPDVTDRTLESLRSFTALRELDLNGTAITDMGLKVIRELPKLEILRLKDTKITDPGFVANLSDKETLRRLDLTGTGVTKDTIKAWKAAKPRRQALP